MASRLRSPLLPGGTGERLYQFFRRRGIEYEAAFRIVKWLSRDSNEVTGYIDARAPDGAWASWNGDGLDGRSYLIDPVMLDACFHVTAPFLADQQEGLWVPASIGRIGAAGACATGSGAGPAGTDRP